MLPEIPTIQYTLFDDDEEEYLLRKEANQKIIDEKQDEVVVRTNEIIRWNQDSRNP